MHTLYIFNPDNDLALASNAYHFTAPPRVASLANDLCTLPYFIASDGDYILVRNSTHKDFVSKLEKQYGRGVKAVLPSNLPDHISKVEPWGWSLSIRTTLQRIGIDSKILPDDKTLTMIRTLSHRRTCNEIMQRLTSKGVNINSEIEIAKECISIDEVQQFVAKHNGRGVMKAPWSSSGRGVYTSISENERPMLQWCQGIINKQGSIMAEPLYDKVLDFALEFRVEPGQKTKFIGYSVFANDSHKSFDHGIIANDSDLRQLILKQSNSETDSGELKLIEQALIEILDEIMPPAYSGYVGIDMMLCKDAAQKVYIKPCVEMNLRCTMGVLTHNIALTDGISENRLFKIKYIGRGATRATNSTAFGINDRVILNPTDGHSNFIAYVE